VQLLEWVSPTLSYAGIGVISTVLQQACYGVMALILVLSITHNLALHYQQKYALTFDPLMVAILAMVTLVAMAHINYGTDFYLYLGVTSVAKGIFCSIVFTELFVFLSRYRFYKFSNLNESLDTPLLWAINSVWAAILTPCLVLILYLLVTDSLDHLSTLLPAFIGNVDANTGFTLFQTIKLIIVNQLSWFVGIHGSSIIEIKGGGFYPDEAIVVYSRQFINLFVHIGGAGCTFGLVIALFFSRFEEGRRLGRYALFPAIFNINELLIFGLPIIFNRFLFIPFLCVPIVTACLFITVFELGWIEWSGVSRSWSTPVLLGGYLSTGQWQGTVLQIVSIGFSAVIYWPFLKRYEQNREQQESAKKMDMLKKLNIEPDLKRIYESKTKMGRFSRFLLSELNDAIDKNTLSLFYQAKVNVHGKVVGAEALMRWNHKELGFISPGMIVELAETDGSIHKLGEWVIQTCLSDIAALNKAGINNVKMAVNMSPTQFEDKKFFDNIIESVSKTRVNPKQIELEITEGQEIIIDEHVLAGLNKLSDFGFSIAIDDFGMGYTSLRYLKSFPINTLKIDGSIIRDVMSSNIVQEIILSIAQLARSMNVQLVAEWVEEDEQMKKLINLGCHQFQGYLMSEAVNLHEFTKYCALTGIVDD
jgi:lactose/cellobiose-specific phosphotransferase system IIC component